MFKFSLKCLTWYAPKQKKTIALSPSKAGPAGGHIFTGICHQQCIKEIYCYSWDVHYYHFILTFQCNSSLNETADKVCSLEMRHSQFTFPFLQGAYFCILFHIYLPVCHPQVWWHLVQIFAIVCTTDEVRKRWIATQSMGFIRNI